MRARPPRVRTSFLRSFLRLFVFGLCTISLGIAVGWGLGITHDIGVIERTTKGSTSLPTRVLDRNGELITSFFSQENRKIVSFQNIPRILMQALITREDQTFFEHSGLSIRGTVRAAYNILLNNFVSGGSTISQQVAGLLYADRKEFSINRKIKELWWSFQLEKNWSKQEILEEYLNKVYFGHGNYGVETSSQFFFGHSAQSINSAEAAMLMIQLANPVRYSPFKNPNRAKARQREILNQMVSLSFLSQEEMERDIEIYWDTFDYTREGFSSAFLERNDKAPYFSEYIRYLLKEELGFSDTEINSGGLTVHTSLDLEFQRKARKHFDEGLEKSNRIYLQNAKRSGSKQEKILPIVALSSLLFDGSEDFFHKSSLLEQKIRDRLSSDLQPTLSMLHLMFEPSPNSLLANLTKEAIDLKRQRISEEKVEGAMITLDNRTGHILTMIGGSSFNVDNQFNRSIHAFVQPGSSFKPLYYAAALEEKLVTPSSIIWDSPVVFFYGENETYTPQNFKGEWKGPVSVRQALSRSMNVPSLKVLNLVGFEKALDLSGRLLNIPKAQRENYGLVEKYPVGLGIVSVSPFAMANAYATIANQGRALPRVAIRYIEDRVGKVIDNTEENLKKKFAAEANNKVISPQTAYILTSILQSTVKQGTLRYAESLAGGFTQPTAGKTGTTQNWSDSWTLGFTPYYTTAIWFGFDRGGQSLGTNQTGAITTGPVWGKYMESINASLPKKEFPKPNGILSLRINPKNNSIATPQTPYAIQELFVVGTEPSKRDPTSPNALDRNYFQENLAKNSWKLNIPYELEGRFEGELADLTKESVILEDNILQKFGLLSNNEQSLRNIEFYRSFKKNKVLKPLNLTLQIPRKKDLLNPQKLLSQRTANTIPNAPAVADNPFLQ